MKFKRPIFAESSTQKRVGLNKRYKNVKQEMSPEKEGDLLDQADLLASEITWLKEVIYTAWTILTISSEMLNTFQ